MLRYLVRQPGRVRPGMQSGVSSHPRPPVRERDSAALFPQIPADWSIGHCVWVFHEPSPVDACATSIQTALSEREHASESVPAYRRQRVTVKTLHKEASSHEWSLAWMRERTGDTFPLTEDARLFKETSSDLDRTGYAWESTSTHLPEYRLYRTHDGRAVHIPFWPGA